MLRAHRVPVVVLDRRVQSPRVDEVRSDSEAGAFQLVRHLIELGHRRIAMLSGGRNISTSADRVSGYRRALTEASIPYDERLVRYEGFGVEGGLRMARDLLRVSPWPTAFSPTYSCTACPHGSQRFRDSGAGHPTTAAVRAQEFEDHVNATLKRLRSRNTKLPAARRPAAAVL